MDIWNELLIREGKEFKNATNTAFSFKINAKLKQIDIFQHNILIKIIKEKDIILYLNFLKMESHPSHVYTKINGATYLYGIFEDIFDSK